MIAIAGGTGRLGMLLVERLLARGESVRVLSRDPAHAIPGAELCVGDVRDARTLPRFVSGARVVVSAVHGFVGTDGVTPASVDRDGNANLVDAAAEAGADVVLISVVGAAPDHLMELFRMKSAAEHQLQTSSVRWTIVRATAFIETWIKVLCDTASGKHGPLVFGRGENPINFVSVRDVAAVVERAIVDPATRGQTLEIAGPEELTFRELAQRVCAAKHLLPPKHIPRAGLRIASIAAALIKPAFARQCRAALALDRMDATFHGDARGSTTVSDVLTTA